MRSRVQVLARTLIPLALAVGLGMGILDRPARSDESVESRRAQYLAQMKDLADSTEIRFQNDRAKPVLVATPVFRYDDQPLRFIDATMWVWTDGGRPVAFEKIEAMIHRDTNEPQWGYCFTSVSTDLLTVEWSPKLRFQSKEPGITFQVLADAPPVAERDAPKKRQARELARGFSARILSDPRNNNTQELRLLPSPIFEYSDPRTNRFLGSVFGYSANGTNPALLVLFEPRTVDGKMQWHFAPARMTSGGVTLKFQDKKVWDTPFVDWHEAPFATWTFYQIHRSPLPGE